MPRSLLILALLLASLTPVWAQPAGEEAPEAPRTLFGFAIPEILSAPAPEELFESDYGHNIRIVGSEAYVADISALLDRLATLPAGAELLQALGASGHPTELSAIPFHELLLSGPNARPLDREAAGYVVGPGGELVPGRGTGGRIHVNPDSVIPETNSEIVLAHELIHVLHYHRGEVLSEEQSVGSNAGTRLEELRTIGTDGYEETEHSENELRGEWNELYPDEPVAPIRTSHGADFAHEGHPPEDPTSSPEDESAAPVEGARREGAARALEGLSQVR